ncbi:MAG: ThiF family adenylyltransferase [Bacilli bacterium]|nr:ThiF family adenylyltransferase [Bacilli bacterium]
MFDRTISLIGEEAFNKIKNSNILILGIGGVGGYAVEALIRSGVENITIVDYDKIDITNINRQIIATSKNVGNNKTEEWQKRILEINPSVKVNIVNEKINKDNINILFNNKYDFIVDACDTVVVKKILIKECKEKNINLITVCGMGKKLNPSLVEICDIRDTSYDPLAKSLRKYIKDEKINGKVPCIFSSERPINNTDNKVIASMIMVPATAGIYAANYVINTIINTK